MQTKKMSLANIQGKLSRSEMKNIMAGSTVTMVCACSNPAMTTVVCNPSSIKSGISCAVYAQQQCPGY